jgi:hypothetical protein
MCEILGKCGGGISRGVRACKRIIIGSHNLFRTEVFAAVTMKNTFYGDIKIQYVPHRKHITSPLQNLAGQCFVRFEGCTAVSMKNAVF